MNPKSCVAAWQRPTGILRATLLTAVLLGSATPLLAQNPLDADSDDVESIDAIIEALYDVISGPAGQERDWNRFRSLFLAGAHLVPSVVTPDGTIRHVVWSPEEYISRAGAQLEEVGFFETEIGRVTEEFGNVAHAFSTYESRREEGEDPFQRGINSIQLFWDGTRWWVVNIAWDQERDDNEIPDKYLN
jgi:hypothetical protein